MGTDGRAQPLQSSATSFPIPLGLGVLKVGPCIRESPEYGGFRENSEGAACVKCRLCLGAGLAWPPPDAHTPRGTFLWSQVVPQRALSLGESSGSSVLVTSPLEGGVLPAQQPSCPHSWALFLRPPAASPPLPPVPRPPHQGSGGLLLIFVESQCVTSQSGRLLFAPL